MKKVEVGEGAITIHFDHAKGLKTTDGKAPTAFWIADSSKKWVKASAEIKEESIILSSPELKNPKYIRYAFAGKPAVNLVNKANLPTLIMVAAFHNDQTIIFGLIDQSMFTSDTSRPPTREIGF